MNLSSSAVATLLEQASYHARAYADATTDWRDLAQAACLRVIVVSYRFDPSRSSWRTFCSRHAWGAVRDEARRLNWFPRPYREENPDSRVLSLEAMGVL